MTRWRYHTAVPLGTVGLATMLAGFAYADAWIIAAGAVLVCVACWEAA